jgi:hypothetical protein
MALAAVVLFGGCPRGGAQAPRGDGAAAWLASGEAPLGGVAIAGDAAVASRGRSLVRTDAGAPTWTQPLPADGGAVAIAGDVVAVAVSGSGAVDGLPLGLRGEPGAAVIGVAAAEWQAALDRQDRRDRVGQRCARCAGAAGCWSPVGSPARCGSAIASSPAPAAATASGRGSAPTA